MGSANGVVKSLVRVHGHAQLVQVAREHVDHRLHGLPGRPPVCRSRRRSLTALQRPMGPSCGASRWPVRSPASASPAECCSPNPPNGTVTGLRIGGEVVWLAKTGAGLSGSPVIMDNSVFVGAEDNGLYCFTPFGEPVV